MGRRQVRRLRGRASGSSIAVYQGINRYRGKKLGVGRAFAFQPLLGSGPFEYTSVRSESDRPIHAPEGRQARVRSGAGRCTHVLAIVGGEVTTRSFVGPDGR